MYNNNNIVVYLLEAVQLFFLYEFMTLFFLPRAAKELIFWTPSKSQWNSVEHCKFQMVCATVNSCGD